MEQQYPASVTLWGSEFVTGARNIMNVKKARGADGGDVTVHGQTCSGRNRIIPLM
jgi:hypothetical protein